MEIYNKFLDKFKMYYMNNKLPDKEIFNILFTGKRFHNIIIENLIEHDFHYNFDIDHDVIYPSNNIYIGYKLIPEIDFEIHLTYIDNDIDVSGVCGEYHSDFGNFHDFLKLLYKNNIDKLNDDLEKCLFLII